MSNPWEYCCGRCDRCSLSSRKTLSWRLGWAAFACFLGMIPLANWMIGHVGTLCAPGGPCVVPVAPGLMAPSGVLTVGAALVLRDVVQRCLGLGWGFAAIVIGAALSALVAPASLVACDAGGVRIMPVLQGYAPADYVAHVLAYGARLLKRMWVGVGSICKRNAKPGAIEAVLLAIKRVRPDLRLHAFGVKITALGSQLVRDLLFSADSMAWSFAARYEGRDGNDPAEAVRYGKRVQTMATQLYLVGT